MGFPNEGCWSRWTYGPNQQLGSSYALHLFVLLCCIWSPTYRVNGQALQYMMHEDADDVSLSLSPPSEWNQDGITKWNLSGIKKFLLDSRWHSNAYRTNQIPSTLSTFLLYCWFIRNSESHFSTNIYTPGYPNLLLLPQVNLP